MPQSTQIIATIGPASNNLPTLQYFQANGVSIGRLNFSHGSIEFHREAAKLCREAGLKIMFDLAGPKVLLGQFPEPIEVEDGQNIVLEYNNSEQQYPYTTIGHESGESIVLPCQFQIDQFVKEGMSIYIDDGKIRIKAQSIQPNQVYCKVVSGGIIKSNKGLNIPGADPDIDFLVERDRTFISALVAECKPEFIAPSFVRYATELRLLQHFVDDLLEKGAVFGYKPGICTKIEQQQAVDPIHFPAILDASDMIMIARGDLALETEPIHTMVPFYQSALIEACHTSNTPCIVATQMLESMITSPVPTRAEVSDVYRAVVLEKADFVMLSAETAAGEFPREAVKLMNDIISLNSQTDPLRLLTDSQSIFVTQSQSV